MNWTAGLILCCILPLVHGEIYRHNDWRDVIPVIRSEVQRLDLPRTKILLERLCTHGVEQVERIGIRCSTDDLGKEFSDIIDNHFHPVAVIYGSFLEADSEDAVVSGWSAETHPSLWGGTLLLSRRNGTWTPVWYRSAIITHSCQKVATASGRELLVCEDRDGGMGHQLHYVYAIDLLKPADRRVSPLAVADSVRSACVERKQRIAAVKWLAADSRLAVTTVTPVWRRTSPEPCAVDPGESPRPPLKQTVVYELRDTGFHELPKR